MLEMQSYAGLLETSNKARMATGNGSEEPETSTAGINQQDTTTELLHQLLKYAEGKTRLTCFGVQYLVRYCTVHFRYCTLVVKYYTVVFFSGGEGVGL